MGKRVLQNQLNEQRIWQTAYFKHRQAQIDVKSERNYWDYSGKKGEKEKEILKNSICFSWLFI